MFMGDWSQVIIGQWTEGFELEVNPYSLDTQGLVRISIMTLADIGFEHAKGISAGKRSMMNNTGMVKIKGVWYIVLDGKLYYFD